MLRSAVPSPSVTLLRPGDAGQPLGTLQAGEGGGRFLSHLLKQITHRDSERLLRGDAQQSCTEGNHHAETALPDSTGCGQAGTCGSTGMGHWGEQGGLQGRDGVLGLNMLLAGTC